MGNLLAIFGAFIAFFLIIGLVLYILGSIGLMKIANKIEGKGGWMAWLPFFSNYLTGKLAFNKLTGWCLVILMFLSSQKSSTINGQTITTGSILPTPFCSIAGLALAILLLVSLYKIYSKVSDKAVIMIIFTVLSFGLLSPIFLFAIRNNPVIGE